MSALKKVCKDPDSFAYALLVSLRSSIAEMNGVESSVLTRQTCNLLVANMCMISKVSDLVSSAVETVAHLLGPRWRSNLVEGLVS